MGTIVPQGKHMMFHDFLEDVVHGRTSVRVLRVLLRHPRKGFTGRELARLSHTAPSKAIRVLNRLREHGVVERLTVGATQLWKAAPDHYILHAARPAFDAERNAMAVLQRHLARSLNHPGVRRVVLFGSVSRGDETPSSDIDLLVIIPRPGDRATVEAQLRKAGESVGRRFGNALTPIIYTEAEARRKRNSALLKRVFYEGVVLLERGRPAG